MKVLIVGTDPSRLGGIETFSKNICNLGFNVEFLTSYKIDTSAMKYSVHYIFRKKWLDYLLFLCMYKVWKKLGLKYLSAKIKKINLSYDVLIINLHYDYFIPVFAKSHARKLLIQHTQSSILKEHRLYFNNNVDLISKAREKFEFISLSDFEKNNLVEVFKLKESSIHTIRHTTDISIRKNDKLFNKNLIMLARFDNSIKRFDLVINAMCLLPDFNLNIYGSGPDELLIKNMSKNKPNVNVFDSIQNVADVLDENSIFVMNSENEGYGITLIEAMSRGLPIIIRDTYPSARDAVINNGVIIDSTWSNDSFKDSVRYIEKNFKSLSAEATLLAERHTLEKIRQEWEKLLF